MPTRTRRGFSLVELMIAIIVMAVVLAGTMNFFMGQSRTFRKATTDMVLLQNARFATDLLNEHFRSVGANITTGQPAVIYADKNVFAFNADYATNIAGDIDAIYYEPKAPTNQTQALLKASAFTIPMSAPALSYPGADWISGAGVPSPAEAITFWFAPDTETTRSDDFVLLRQVNSSAPEVVVRNVLPDSTFPFFRYMYLKIDPAGVQSIDTIAGTDLPMDYGKDTIVYKDRFRGVLISFTVTNGLADTAERTRPVSVIASLPNIGMRQLQTCGAKPLPTSPPVVSKVTPGTLRIIWTASPDESGGERDVMRYQVTRMASFAPGVWQNVASVPAGGTYDITDAGLNTGFLYSYAIAAQDCTPAFSASVASGGVQPN
ncbi:MAG TPA: prepilin-type N-terminal cleavage/methylation domain-containing protein [Gemmatimonadaceae bacterium]|jgi:prepilin-type N-terminal cleavage/methylation domain-containing protein|nr:prepilin-type N-terminal cleavage/methylation domain-containing protein [Gemmatimonadaceae bacterium]